MALYLVEHIPYADEVDQDIAAQPTNLAGLAEHALATTRGARWLTTFSPDLHDDRQFSLWESPDVDSIRVVMARFGFLSDGIVKAFAVRQWGPEDVISSRSEDWPAW